MADFWQRKRSDKDCFHSQSVPIMDVKYGAIASSGLDLEDLSDYQLKSADKIVTTDASTSWRHTIAGAAVVGLSLSAVLLFTTNASSNARTSSMDSYESSNFAAIVTNEYTPLNLKRFNYDFLKKAVLLEPWRDNNVEIQGLDSSCDNSWVLRGKDTLTEEVFSGTIDQDNKFVAVPKKTGFYSLSVTSS